MVVGQQEIPLVPAELGRAATANTCVDVLLHLEALVDEVFSALTNRLADTSSRLDGLKQRASEAQAKVDRLTGIRKATQVFSSAQYPGGETYEPYRQVHTGTGPSLPFQSTPAHPAQDSSPHSASLQEKLQFYHVRERKSGGGGGGGRVLGGLIGEETDREDGLGRLPPHLSSVSSLLLFNTTHNPYKKYMVLDPLGVVSGTRGVAPRSRAGTGPPTPPTLHDAPTTLQDGDQVGLIARESSYQYLPDLADVPDLDLPLELPSLPGVANDLLYEGGADPTIAPSLLLHDGPFLRPTNTTPPTTQPPPPTSSTTTKSQPAPSPPQPPPTTTTTTTPPTTTTIAAAAAVTPAPPPAPPAPPPPPPPLPPSGAAPESVPAVALTEARNDLMRAIQEAGGVGKAKLKSAKDSANRKRQGSSSGGGSEKVSTPKAPAGDLMSDLFNRLSQRRKGISGAQSKPPSEGPRMPGGGSSGGNTMERLSSFIPPPPLTSDGGKGGREGSDEDWD